VKHLAREAFWYSAASGVALATDVSLLWLLVEHAHWHYLSAATVAFLAGTAVVYGLSVGWIFQHRRVEDRRLEFGLFAFIGVLGVIVNLTVLTIAVDVYGLHYLVGKLASVGVTFTLNFGLRRTFLFSAPGRRRCILTNESRTN